MLCHLVVDELRHFAVVARRSADMEGQSVVSKVISETYKLQPPDVQRPALVEEHESARIIKIISKTKIGEVGNWEENPKKTTYC